MKRNLKIYVKAYLYIVTDFTQDSKKAALKRAA